MKTKILVFLTILSFGLMSCADHKAKIEIALDLSYDVIQKIKSILPDFMPTYETNIHITLDKNQPNSVYITASILPPGKDMDENTGFVFKYDADKQLMIHSQPLQGIESDTFVFGDKIIVKRWAKQFYYYMLNEQTLDTITSPLSDQNLENTFDTVLMDDNQIVRIGWYRSVNDYFLNAYDLAMTYLWTYPDIKHTESDIFPLLDMVEIAGKHHLIYSKFNKKTHQYNDLYHVALQADTGKILLDEKLLPDMNELWNTTTRTANEIGKRVIWDGKEVFIEGQDKNGIYISKFEITDVGSLKSVWKKTISNLSFDDVSLPSRGSGLKQIVVSKQNSILMPIWTQKGLFDLYCIDPDDGSQRWIYQSIPMEEISIQQNKDNILIYSVFNIPGSDQYPVMVIDSKSGKKIWENRFESKEPIEYELFNGSLYMYSPDNNTLMQHDISNGELIAEHVFQQDIMLFGYFYKNQDHLFFYIEDQQPYKFNTSVALLYEISVIP
ncbi:PQQ-like beta-propeller repeat protein [bacterium]|nr:PQQ-like beta-propeller repeat protein [bacterium]